MHALVIHGSPVINPARSNIMPKCSTCHIGTGETIGQCHACWRAQTESRKGYVQHVNRIGEQSHVSDWIDSSTVVSFKNGRQISSPTE